MNATHVTTVEFPKEKSWDNVDQENANEIGNAQCRSDAMKELKDVSLINAMLMVSVEEKTSNVSMKNVYTYLDVRIAMIVQIEQKFVIRNQGMLQ